MLTVFAMSQLPTSVVDRRALSVDAACGQGIGSHLTLIGDHVVRNCLRPCGGPLCPMCSVARECRRV